MQHFNKQVTLMSLIVVASLFFTACDSPGEEESDANEIQHILILGRNGKNTLQRPAIYHASIPHNWLHHAPPIQQSLTDTMKPIYEMAIHAGDQKIAITLHNFPCDTIETRIPPEAQAARWKRQLVNAEDITITPQAFGGFCGLRFEAEGVIDGQKKMIIGWSMQLSPEHFYALNQEHEGLSDEEREQMRADYTIKAVGPLDLVKKYRATIHRFARSFRLIQPIPQKR